MKNALTVGNCMRKKIRAATAKEVKMSVNCGSNLFLREVSTIRR